MGSSKHPRKAERVRRRKRRPKSEQSSTPDAELRAAAIRSLEKIYAVADVLYRALRGVDLHSEDPRARVLRECIIDDIGRTLDILIGLPIDRAPHFNEFVPYDQRAACDRERRTDGQAAPDLAPAEAFVRRND